MLSWLATFACGCVMGAWVGFHAARAHTVAQDLVEANLRPPDGPRAKCCICPNEGPPGSANGPPYICGECMGVAP